MASRRKLKKQVVHLVGQLYEEALILLPLSNQAVAEQLETFIDDLIVFTDDTIRRIQHPDGKDSPALVKAYYRKVKADIRNKEEEFNQRLEALIIED